MTITHAHQSRREVLPGIGAHARPALPSHERRSFLVSPLLDGIETLSAEYRDHHFSTHARASAVIGVIERGQVVVRADGETFLVNEASVIVVPPGVLHAVRSADGLEWGLRALYLSTPQMLRLLPDVSVADKGLLGSRPFVRRDPRLARRVLLALASLRRTTDSDPQRALAHMREVVGELESVARNTVGAPRRRLSRPTGVERVRRLLDEDPLPKRSLADLADLAHLSRFGFAHAFARAYGIGAHAYVLQRRVLAVRDLLVSGELVSRAAHHAGFADQSHLTRRFLSVLGVPPGEFRRAWQQARGLQRSRFEIAPGSDIGSHDICPSGLKLRHLPRSSRFAGAR